MNYIKICLFLSLVVSLSLHLQPILSTKDEIITTIFDNYWNSIYGAMNTYLTYDTVTELFVFQVAYPDPLP